MRVHNVEEYQIYATSALRESLNSSIVISKIKKATGLRINIITGLKEAKIIAKGNRLSKLEYNKTYLYVDVGGGSTEYSILKKGANKKSKSFKFGTVRLLNKLDLSHTKDEITSWLTKNIDFKGKRKSDRWKKIEKRTKPGSDTSKLSKDKKNNKRSKKIRVKNKRSKMSD